MHRGTLENWRSFARKSINSARPVTTRTTLSRRRRSNSFSLTPCFSWVPGAVECVRTVSTVSTVCAKPLKRLLSWQRDYTQLKQGVNQKLMRKWLDASGACGLHLLIVAVLGSFGHCTSPPRRRLSLCFVHDPKPCRSASALAADDIELAWTKFHETAKHFWH